MRRGAGAGARSAGALPQQLCELLRRPAGSSGASDGLHACSRLLAAGQQRRHHWPLTAATVATTCTQGSTFRAGEGELGKAAADTPLRKAAASTPPGALLQAPLEPPRAQAARPSRAQGRARSEAGGGGRGQGLCWRHLPGWPSRACTCRPPGRAPLRRRAGCPRPSTSALRAAARRGKSNPAVCSRGWQLAGHRHT
jgi:hypothetical protein